MTNPQGFAPLVGVCGLAGSGKDEVAKVFVEFGWHRRALADPMREMLLALDPLISAGETRVSQAVHHYGWDVAKRSYPEIRILLQRLGTEVVRKNISEDFWIDKLLIDWFSGGNYPTVVPDIRYPNEAEYLRSEGGLLIRVQREGMETMGHVSESHVNDLPADVTLFNDGSLEALHLSVRTLMHELDLFEFEALPRANHTAS